MAEQQRSRSVRGFFHQCRVSGVTNRSVNSRFKAFQTFIVHVAYIQ